MTTQPDKLVVSQEAERFASGFADSILCHPTFVAQAFQRAMNQAADERQEMCAKVARDAAEKFADQWREGGKVSDRTAGFSDGAAYVEKVIRSIGNEG